jgi:lysophospholipase L1-like esterase
MNAFARRAPLFLAIPLAVVLGLGVRDALRPGRGDLVPPPAPPAAVALPRGTRLVVALGDSLTRGRGDDTGRGYVGDLAASLPGGSGAVRVENLAVDGLESRDLLASLAEPNVRALVSRANLVLLSIGGNDLSHSAEALARGAPGGIEAARARLEANLARILGELRRLNARAPIRILGLYDPLARSGPAAAGSAVVLDWSSMIARVAAAHEALAVPTFDLFEGRADRLSPDHFHPNADGYRLIAERVRQTL